MKNIKYLFVSDTHLGAKSSNSHAFYKLLKSLEDSETLEKVFLIGDIIDGWKWRSNRFYWTEIENKIIRKLIKINQKGIKIIYVCGNHDDFLRQYLKINLIPNFEILDEYILELENQKILIIHGDKFDGIIKSKFNNKWLVSLGDNCYEMILNISDWYMKKFNSKFSISKFIKSRFKQAMTYISSFEEHLFKYAKINGCNKVVCGHIHCPKIDNNYMNTGDFQENNSFIWMDCNNNFFLVEDYDNG